MIIETGIHILNKITRKKLKQNFVDCRFIPGGALRAFGRCGGQPAGYRNSYTIQTKQQFPDSISDLVSIAYSIFQTKKHKPYSTYLLKEY